MSGERWPQPAVTANAQLLMGYLLGAVNRADYRAVDWQPEQGTLTLENQRNGNQYQLTVRQVSGTE